MSGVRRRTPHALGPLIALLVVGAASACSDDAPPDRAEDGGWRRAADLPSSISQAETIAVHALDDHVVVVASTGDGAVVAVSDDGARTWEAAGPPELRAAVGGTTATAGAVVVFGDSAVCEVGTDRSLAGRVLDVAAGTWADLPPAPFPVSCGVAVASLGTELLVWPTGAPGDGARLDLDERAWGAALPALAGAGDGRADGVVVAAAGDTVVAFGPDGATATLRPDATAWAPADRLDGVTEAWGVDDDTIGVRTAEGVGSFAIDDGTARMTSDPEEGVRASAAVAHRADRVLVVAGESADSPGADDGPVALSPTDSGYEGTVDPPTVTATSTGGPAGGPAWGAWTDAGPLVVTEDGEVWIRAL